MSTPSTQKADALLERIWQGLRSQSYGLGHPSLTVAMTPEDRYVLATADLPIRWTAAISWDYSDSKRPPVLLAFGYPVTEDRTLLPTEIRLRTEVTI